MPVTVRDVQWHSWARAGDARLAGVPEFLWCPESVKNKNFICRGCGVNPRALTGVQQNMPELAESPRL